MLFEEEEKVLTGAPIVFDVVFMKGVILENFEDTESTVHRLKAFILLSLATFRDCTCRLIVTVNSTDHDQGKYLGTYFSSDW